MNSEEFYASMFKRCKEGEKPTAVENLGRRLEEGVYAFCTGCSNPIYQYMTQNREIYDATQLCGVCATGESAVYFEELNQL